MPYFPYFRNHAPRCSTGLFHGTGRSIQTYMALPSMPSMPCIAFCLAVPKLLFREHLCARFWHRLGLQSCWGSGVSQPCLTVNFCLCACHTFPTFATVPHGAPQGFSMVLAGPSRHIWLCLLCLLCLALPSVSQFRRCYFESISAHASGTALGFNPAGDPVFRNHASQYSTGLFHGTGRSIQTSMALPCMPCICLPCVCIALSCLVLVCVLYCLVLVCIVLYLAVPKMLFREHLCARFWHRLGLQSCWGSGVSQPCLTVLHKAFPWYWPVHPDIYGFAFYAFYALHCLLFSSSEDAISRASLRTLLAPPWASILLGIRCFATMPHSKFLSLCMPYFPYFRNHAPRCSTGLFHGTGRSIQTYMALPSMPCIAFCFAVPKMLFREHLCARFWHRLGLQSCWGSGVSQPCLTVLHRAFPWYWPVHPDIYGFALYAVHMFALCMYCLVLPCPCMCIVLPCPCMYCLVFSGSEDAISGASLRTLLAPPWASILLGIRCFATMPHRAPQGFSMVLAGPSRHLWLCLRCLLCLAYAFYALHCLLFSSSEDAISRASLRALLAPPWASILLGIRCFATMPHRAPQGFSMVLAGPSRQLWLCLLCLLRLAYALHCLLLSSSEDAISRASLRTLLAPPWASILLGIRCFATMPPSTPQGFSMVLAGPSRHLWLCLVCRVSIQTSMALPYMPCICLPCVCIALLLVLPCPCMYCIVVCIAIFSGSEDAISRASLRTLLARPWASILLGIRCLATMPHRAPQGFSMVLAGPSRHLWLCLLCLLCLALPSVSQFVCHLLYCHFLSILF